jgi:hypothetical protein
MSNVTVTDRFKGARIIALLTIIAGVVMIVAGGITWGTVSSQLADEKMQVAAVTAQDPGSLAGKNVVDPFTAYAQAEAINHHSLTATNGRTYAQLGGDITAATKTLTDGGMSAADAAKDPSVVKLQGERSTIQTGSLLRASLFTSIVAFGVAALVIGLGILFILVGFALRSLTAKPAVAAAATVAPATVNAHV